ncbi:MAG: hypothetical protein PF572_03425 [Patescibacteria group bacterium]|jgi:hypothetical protein|nr:hypothetical protein [Patescibacteria group bacterium]
MYNLSFREKALIWSKYINLFRNGHPSIGKLNDADYAIVLSFGRITISNEDFFYVIKNLPRCKDNILSFDELIKTFDFDSGISNIEIAKECYLILKKYRIKIFVQWEVAFEMYRLHPQNYKNFDKLIVSIWPETDKKNFTTMDVLQQIKTKVSEDSLKQPILIANNWMSIRAALLVKKQIGTFPVLTPLDCSSFNLEAIQKWVNSYSRWIVYETLTRMHHFLFKWI